MSVNQTLFCGQCGKPNHPTQKFCGYCGAPLVAPPPAQLQHPTKPAKPLTRREMKIALIIGGVLVPLCVIGALTDPKNTKQPAALQQSTQAPPAVVPSPAAVPAETLERAKSHIGPGASKGQLIQAHGWLVTIPKTAPEHKEAQRLMKQWSERIEALAREEAVNENPLEVVSSNWERGGFNTVAVWHVTFRNRSQRSVGDITYRTSYFSESGNKVDSGGVDSLIGDKMIQKVIPPGQKRTIEVNDGFVHSEAATARFELVGWRFVGS